MFFELISKHHEKRSGSNCGKTIELRGGSAAAAAAAAGKLRLLSCGGAEEQPLRDFENSIIKTVDP